MTRRNEDDYRDGYRHGYTGDAYDPDRLESDRYQTGYTNGRRNRGDGDRRIRLQEAERERPSG